MYLLSRTNCFCKKIVFALLALASHSAYAIDPAKVIEIFQQAYPGFFKDSQGNILIWSNGQTDTIDDGLQKTFEDMLNTADIEDQLSLRYPTGSTSYAEPDVNFDPGRFRYEPLFKKMYGASPKEVENNLTTIAWMPCSTNLKIRFSRINNADQHLASVSTELDNLPNHLKRYVANPAGTYYWRNIAGTSRLSAHSFGIAIDISLEGSDYWQWDKNSKKAYIYRNKIPREIVEIFEKHGFIWGGKWYHYDTMHFEYRPELLVSY
jgi:hypothetical protein